MFFFELKLKFIKIKLIGDIKNNYGKTLLLIFIVFINFFNFINRFLTIRFITVMHQLFTYNHNSVFYVTNINIPKM